MKLFIIINYIDENIFLNYYNYIILKRKEVIIRNYNFIKIFNIDNDFFLSLRHFFKFNINYFIDYENRKSERNRFFKLIYLILRIYLIEFFIDKLAIF